jgi:hypothetical protein
MGDVVTHEPDCAGWEGWDEGSGICQSWCHGCMRCEPLREGDYLVCGECWHVFRTATELVEMDLAIARKYELHADHRPADQIASCPVCAHDF